MIKTIICLRRKPGLSRDDFLQYWINDHAKLVQELSTDLKIIRYIQSHALDNDVSALLRNSRSGPEMFDGTGEAWFESLQVLQSLQGDKKALAAMVRLIEDERKFIDLSNSPFWVAEEHLIPLA